MPIYNKYYSSIILLILITSLSAPDIIPEQEPSTLVFPPYLHSYGIRKATQTKLKLLLGLSASFKNPQGIVAVRLKSQDDPATEHDDDEVTVYGVNSNRHQIIYNTSMYAITCYGKPGSGVGNFQFPKGVAADENGNVYIADTGNNRIVHLFNPKDRLQWVQTLGDAGNKGGNFNSPEGIAIDSKNRLYVADTKNNRILILSPEGNFLQELRGHPGEEFAGPTQLAVCDKKAPWAYYREDAIFVIDKNRKRIQKFDFTGKRLAKREDRAAQNVRFEYICLDFYNQAYVTDFNGGKVLKFDRDLRPLASFGSPGSGDREFNEPRGITLWKRYGQVFVAEKTGAQYYWVGTDVHDIDLPAKDARTCGLTFTLTEPSFFSCALVSENDTTTLWKRRRLESGKNSLAFLCDREKDHGKNLLMRFEPTYSSYTYIAKDIRRKVP
jgi:hypothetical protein